MEELASLVTQLGFGGLTGFLVGYPAKKVVKILLVVLGVYILSLQYLAHEGFISIDYERLYVPRFPDCKYTIHRELRDRTGTWVQNRLEMIDFLT